MARILSPGDTVNGYTIARLLDRGAMAISYEARGRSGEKCFFKQYKSPGPMTPWYRAYVRYQAEIKRRIEEGDARRYCYRFIDFFEADAGAPCYFQVFELIEAGQNLRALLAPARAPSWEQRLTWARVMMRGVTAVHEAGVIHSDLKPENVYLIRDPALETGYTLRLIDFDYSVQADRKAPWDAPGSGQGYVGTPAYYSPEHLVHPPPVFASDVFTCGLILYELLDGKHPYPAGGDEDQYRKLALSGNPPLPRLRGSVGSAEKDAALIESLRRALTPKPKERPTARELFEALKGGAALPSARRWRCPKCGVENEAREGRVCDACGEAQYGRLVLRGEKSGKELSMSAPATVGRPLLKSVADAADLPHFGFAQFRVGRDASRGAWTITPDPAAPVPTNLNGAALSRTAALKDGDRISIGTGLLSLLVAIRY